MSPRSLGVYRGARLNQGRVPRGLLVPLGILTLLL